MKNKFLVPIVTPFNDDETVNYDALYRLTKNCCQTARTEFTLRVQARNVFYLAKKNGKRWKR